jgi:hypothetical protein
MLSPAQIDKPTASGHDVRRQVRLGIGAQHLALVGGIVDQHVVRRSISLV